MQASLAGRYARALFDLAEAGAVLPAVEASVATLGQALAASPELQALTTSPVVSRGDATKAIAATASALKLDPLTSNLLGVLATNRRLSEIGNVVRSFAAMAAAHRGEASAEVVSAHPLSTEQVSALKTQLKRRVGRDVAVDLSVDPALLGGMVVKIGSRQIDSSIRTRLNTLAAAMKG